MDGEDTLCDLSLTAMNHRMTNFDEIQTRRQRVTVLIKIQIEIK